MSPKGERKKGKKKNFNQSANRSLQLNQIYNNNNNNKKKKPKKK